MKKRADAVVAAAKSDLIGTSLFWLVLRNRSFPVGLHEPRVTHHVGTEYGSEAAHYRRSSLGVEISGRSGKNLGAQRILGMSGPG